MPPPPTPPITAGWVPATMSSRIVRVALSPSAAPAGKAMSLERRIMSRPRVAPVTVISPGVRAVKPVPALASAIWMLPPASITVAPLVVSRRPRRGGERAAAGRREVASGDGTDARRAPRMIDRDRAERRGEADAAADEAAAAAGIDPKIAAAGGSRDAGDGDDAVLEREEGGGPDAGPRRRGCQRQAAQLHAAMIGDDLPRSGQRVGRRDAGGGGDAGEAAGDELAWRGAEVGEQGTGADGAARRRRLQAGRGAGAARRAGGRAGQRGRATDRDLRAGRQEVVAPPRPPPPSPPTVPAPAVAAGGAALAVGLEDHRRKVRAAEHGGGRAAGDRAGLRAAANAAAARTAIASVARAAGAAEAGGVDRHGTQLQHTIARLGDDLAGAAGAAAAESPPIDADAAGPPPPPIPWAETETVEPP